MVATSATSGCHFGVFTAVRSATGQHTTTAAPHQPPGSSGSSPSPLPQSDIPLGNLGTPGHSPDISRCIWGVSFPPVGTSTPVGPGVYPLQQGPQLGHSASGRKGPYLHPKPGQQGGSPVYQRLWLVTTSSTSGCHPGIHHGPGHRRPSCRHYCLLPASEVIGQQLASPHTAGLMLVQFGDSVMPLSPTLGQAGTSTPVGPATACNVRGPSRDPQHTANSHRGSH